MAGLLSSVAKAGVKANATNAGLLSPGIRAFHGSPHDFDRFSTDAIGTGEGAQQYGHGLYFAQNEKVAKEYRDQLTPRDHDYEDWLMGKYKDAENNQDYARMEMYERAMMHDTPQDFKDLAADTDYDDDYRELAAEIGEEIEEYGANFGSMYEVDIDANPDELLDYYAPLKDQPKKVQKAIDDLMTLDGVESYSADGFKVYTKTGVTGETLGHDILNHYNGKVGTKEGVKVLEFAGIKGIKYPDAFTRHKSPDKQSSNYVIFNDELISIANKYGVSIPVAAAMLSQTQDADAANPSTAAATGGLLGSGQVEGGFDKVAGIADAAANAAAGMVAPILSAPGAVARYLGDRYVPGVDFSAEDIARERQNTEQFFDYQPRTELGQQYSDQGMQALGGLLAPVVDASQGSNIIDLLKSGYNKMGKKEKELTKALLDMSPI